jgi:hypothetical protein
MERPEEPEGVGKGATWPRNLAAPWPARGPPTGGDIDERGPVPVAAPDLGGGYTGARRHMPHTGAREKGGHS